MIGTISCWANFEDQFNQIKQIENLSGVLILGEMEFYYDQISGSREALNFVVDYAESKRVPVYFTTGLSHKDNKFLDSNPLRDKIKVLYWPTYWFSSAFLRMHTDYTKPYNDELGLYIENNTDYNNKFTHTFLSMNYQPHIHRCLLMDSLAKHNLIKNNKISWRKKSRWTFKHWKQEMLIIDQPDAENIPIGLKREKMPDSYKECFVQIVTESESQTTHTVSMSTAVPLFLCKPFLVLGKQNYMQYLEEFGFVRYDEIFDYSFDKIENLEDRVEALVHEIKRIDAQKNMFKHMYSQIYPKLVYNRKRAMQLATDDKLYPDVWKQVATQDYIPNHFNRELYPAFFMSSMRKLRDKYRSEKKI
jgi:hypothetical protein